MMMMMTTTMKLLILVFVEELETSLVFRIKQRTKTDEQSRNGK